MKVASILVFVMLTAFAAGCNGDGSECNCMPWEVCIDGVCVVPDADADGDEDTVTDTSDDGIDGEGIDDGVDGIDGVVDGDVSTDTEEEECLRPCTTHEECNDDNVCTEDWCAPVTGCCVYFTEGPQYSNCGDDLFCNGADYCLDGECVHEDVDCTGGGPCTEGACDEDNDMCVFTPLPDDTSCDDGDWCTGENNTCLDGECQYTWPCPMSTDPCKNYECDSAAEACNEVDQLDGWPCPDSDVCNGDEYCLSGACTGVIPPCVDGDPCTYDNCSGEGICDNPAIPDCVLCDDPAPCIDDDDCTADYCRVVGGVTECENIRIPMCMPTP